MNDEDFNLRKSLGEFNNEEIRCRELSQQVDHKILEDLKFRYELGEFSFSMFLKRLESQI